MILVVTSMMFYTSHLSITSEYQMNSRGCVDDGNRVRFNEKHIRASIFVKSLVSPNPY